MGVTKLVFELLALKPKLKDASTGCSVAMVAYYPIKMTTTRLSISEHLRDINLLHRRINTSCVSFLMIYHRESHFFTYILTAYTRVLLRNENIKKTHS